MAFSYRKRGDSWQVQMRVSGFPTATATFKRKADCERWATNKLAALQKGASPLVVRPVTFGELVQEYLSSKTFKDASEKYRVGHAHALKWWQGEIGAYRLTYISPKLITDAKDKLSKTNSVRGKPYSPASVMRSMAALAAALKYAVRSGDLMRSPIHDAEKPVVRNDRKRHLSVEELNSLLQQCRESSCSALFPVVVLAVSTGMRKSEILSLKWEDVSLGHGGPGHIQLLKTKNGDPRPVPLVGAAQVALKSWRKTCVRDKRSYRKTAFVFPSADKDAARSIDIRSAWETAMKRAKLKDFRFHDLRHTAASNLAMSGATLLEIGAVLGHRSAASTKRYTHLSSAHLVNVVVHRFRTQPGPPAPRCEKPQGAYRTHLEACIQVYDLDSRNVRDAEIVQTVPYLKQVAYKTSKDDKEPARTRLRDIRKRNVRLFEKLEITTYANRYYGELGHRLAKALGMTLLRDEKRGRPVGSTAIGIFYKPKNSTWQLMMHHELARAIERSGIFGS